MSGMRCLRCGHFPNDHAPRGGACNAATYTTERRDLGGDEGVEVIEDVTYCPCSYLLLGA